MSQFALIFSTITSDSDMVARRRSWGDDFIYVVPAGKYSPYTPVAHHLVNDDGLVEYLPYIARYNAAGRCRYYNIKKTAFQCGNKKDSDNNGYGKGRGIRQGARA